MKKKVEKSRKQFEVRKREKLFRQVSLVKMQEKGERKRKRKRDILLN